MWDNEIEQLKSILAKTDLIETKKWGIPVYTYNGKNVVGIAGFKNHYALWFYNGVFLSDPAKVLLNAQKGKTKALRQWRFNGNDRVDEKLLTAYIKEAIKNEQDGKVWKPQKEQAPTSDILSNALENNKKAATAFANLTPYKQKEYTEYIATAKREQTKITRLEKIIPMIEKGIGLHDKYR